MGRLPPSMSQGLITLIPKPGKDPMCIENWRPITLINNDVKLLSLTFARRLKPCLQTIIDDCQSGFMSGRHISNNVCLILDLIDNHEFIDDNSLTLFIDYYKTFDNIEHSFLFNSLDFLGFAFYFKSAIQTYKRYSSSVKLLNGTTHSFNIKRGIKQGDPIASFLFLLIMQTMVLHINKDYLRGIQLAESQLKCCQLADDTTILKNEKEVNKTIDCLDTFSLVSGLKVNIKKCELFALKDRPNKK